MAPVTNSSTTDHVVVNNSTQDKLKKFFEDKDWKFYCAIAAGLTLAGAGAYYISTSSSASASSKKSKKKPETKKESPKGKSC